MSRYDIALGKPEVEKNVQADLERSAQRVVRNQRMFSPEFNALVQTVQGNDPPEVTVVAQHKRISV